MDDKTYRTRRDQLCKELIEFLRERELDYGQALITLKDVHLWVERTSLKNRL